jgi:hypothetical protein
MRAGKVGIDYFSHDVDMLQDRKIRLLKAKHKLIGYAIYLRLLEEIYRENGYYLKTDDNFNILFADDNNLDYNVYILVLNDCIEFKLFDKDLYQKYNIITSKRIQENYCQATARRHCVSFYKEYLLIDPTRTYGNKNGINVNILSLNADIGTQSKEKGYRKKNENEKEKKEVPQIPDGISDHLLFLSLQFHQKQKDLGRHHVDFKQPLTKESKVVTQGAVELDKLQRLDKVDIATIERVLEFIPDDEFWGDNCVSLAGIRKRGKNGNIKFFNIENSMNAFVEKQNKDQPFKPLRLVN